MVAHVSFGVCGLDSLRLSNSTSTLGKTAIYLLFPCLNLFYTYTFTLLVLMDFRFGSLEPRIYQILSAPGTDLTTISAKRVRRQLPDLDPTLSAEFLREHKVAVDEVIASVFERVSAEADHLRKRIVRKEEEEEEEEDLTGEDGGEDGSPPIKKSKKKGTKQEQADAELARKLSSEINGRSTRTSGKSRGGVVKRGIRAKKSAVTVNSDDESMEEGGKKTRKRAANGSGAKGGFAKEFALR